MSTYIVLSLAVLAIAVTSSLSDEVRWITIGCWLIFAVGLLGIVDAALSFVELGDSELRMRKNFRKSVVARSDIKSISVAKGCPISIHLANGSRVEIPDLGGQGLDNSLRSWIRAT